MPQDTTVRPWKTKSMDLAVRIGGAVWPDVPSVAFVIISNTKDCIAMQVIAIDGTFVQFQYFNDRLVRLLVQCMPLVSLHFFDVSSISGM